MLASESSINETHLYPATEACRPRRRILVLARAAAVLLAFAVCLPVSAQSSLRYYGGMATNQVDRVKIRIDPPGPLVDVGATDFTVELFLKTASGNSRPLPACGVGTYNWIEGNIFLDRNRYGLGRDYGLALGGGRVMFGIRGTNGEQATICGTSNIADGQWHHVAVQRRPTDGHMWLYVDGTLENEDNGPDGDISYPDNGPVGTGCGGPCTQSDPFLVIGTEKHDQAFGFSGWIDELRVSTLLRYSANFTPTTTPFAFTAGTAALYHFDEGSGDVIVDATPGSLSPGVRFFGQGGVPGQQGPTWETDSPFGGTPSPGTVQFQSATATVGEGAPTANITVTRSGGTAGAASVRYLITGGTATSGSDFTPLAADTLNWAPGDGAAKTISISLINDAAVEPAETINLQLSNATGATLGATTTTTLTINDNDAPPAPGTIEFQAASSAAGEVAGTAVITVTRANGSAGAASVQIQITGGTATAGSDHTALATNTLSWVDGDGAAKSVSISLINDTEVEVAETIILQLSNATGATLGSTTTSTVTITDNDASPPPPGGGGGGGGGGGFDWLALCVLLGGLARALSYSGRLPVLTAPRVRRMSAHVHPTIGRHTRPQVSAVR